MFYYVLPIVISVYDIEIKTDDKSKAGTIHNGWIILKGKKGTGKLKMKNTPRYPILRRSGLILVS